MYTEFPSLNISPLHNFKKWDYLRILGNAIDIGLLLLMGVGAEFDNETISTWYVTACKICYYLYIFVSFQKPKNSNIVQNSQIFVRGGGAGTSRIRGTLNLLTDAERSTNTILRCYMIFF